MVAAVPLLASMRADPRIAERLEHGGCGGAAIRLGGAARRVRPAAQPPAQSESGQRERFPDRPGA
ncbi:hypothetical protein I553_3772 [Mycobacterium xenopi 4042]|uniref:Uncharacterized protein n=1 Tax=Mycobacterium xenopi 4042 TaxID=1299334 RepID=X8BDH2_MYCXE|nr:hypothetical protein I553_3772 [Mycobacterium xenopi 4042]